MTTIMSLHPGARATLDARVPCVRGVPCARRGPLDPGIFVAPASSMPIPLQTGIVYGPMRSRRLGRSLGVNLLPENRKTCNFNCPYCQYGWTRRGPASAWPSPRGVAEQVENALARGCRLDVITLAGNGEPTLHPAFGEVVERLRLVRDRLAPGVRLAVLSNASTLGSPAVVAALRRLDQRCMKLDAGDDGTVARMNGVRIPVETIVEGLQRLDDVVLQSMFVRGGPLVDNTSPHALDAWTRAVLRIRPSAVHVYSLDRPAASRRLLPVPRADLERIAARLADDGIQATVY